MTHRPTASAPTFDGEDRFNPLVLKAPDLIKWIEARDPRAIGSWRDLGADEYSRAFAAAQTAGANVIDDLYFAFYETIERGGTEVDFAKLVTPTLKEKGWLAGDDGKIARRVALIYDTNLRMARAAGEWERIQRNKVGLPYLLGVTAKDSRVRHPPKSHDDHRAWEGILLPVDHPFWTRWFPPLGFRCFLPETRIEGAVKAGIRRWHQGKAVKLLVASGRELSVTPDHPILTQRGWVLAEHVRVGDHCLRARSIVNGRSQNAVDHRDSPARAEDLFNAIRANALRSADCLPLQLNDESGGGQGKIDIVFADPVLAQEIRAEVFGEVILVRAAFRADDPFGSLGSVQNRIGEAYPCHSGQPGNLAFADTQRISNAAHRSIRIGRQYAEPCFDLGVSVPTNLPGHSALPLSATRRLFDGLPLEEFRLASPSQDDALFAELAAHAQAADAGLFSNLLETHSASVEIDEVVDVQEFDFAGHVYDFQTEEGILAAESLVVHNCRCSTIQITRSRAMRLGGQTSAEDLAEREARLGPPVFTPPGAGVAQQVAEMLNAEPRALPNGQPQPALPLPSLPEVRAEGNRLWDLEAASAAIDALLDKLFA